MSSGECSLVSAHSLQQILARLINFAIAFLLLALSIWWPLSQKTANVFWMLGLNGLAFYFAMELVADQRARQEQQALLDSHERLVLGDKRLSERLIEEQIVANIRGAELRQKTKK